MVHNLMDPYTKAWDLQKLNTLFSRENMEAVKLVKIPLEEREDAILRTLDSSGVFFLQNRHIVL